MLDFQKIIQIYKVARSLSLKDAAALIKAAKRRKFNPGEILIRRRIVEKNK